VSDKEKTAALEARVKELERRQEAWDSGHCPDCLEKIAALTKERDEFRKYLVAAQEFNDKIEAENESLTAQLAKAREALNAWIAWWACAFIEPVKLRMPPPVDQSRAAILRAEGK
jgi:hypothetical protein